MKVLETVFDIIEQGLGVCFVLIMFVSVLLQIFYRYVLQSPLTSTEDAARYSFIWIVLLGAAFAVRKKRTRRHGDTIQSFSKIASEIRHGDHRWDHPSS